MYGTPPGIPGLVQTNITNSACGVRVPTEGRSGYIWCSPPKTEQRERTCNRDERDETMRS